MNPENIKKFREYGLVVRCFTEFARQVCDEAIENGIVPLAIMDVSLSLPENNYKGIPIVHTSEISNYNAVCFYIARASYLEIKEELVACGVPDDKIVTLREDVFYDRVQPKNMELCGKFDFQENWTNLCAEWGKAEFSRCMPVYITIETSVKCNLNCIMCYYHDEKNKERFADLKALYRVDSFDYLFMNAKIVTPQIGGEPLIDPLFWELIERAAALWPDVLIKFNTNGTLLTASNIARLVENLHNAAIIISLDGATERTQNRIRGCNLEKLKGNIRAFVEAKNKAGKKNIVIILGMTVMRENLEEMDAFVRLGAELGVNVVRVWAIHPANGEKEWYVEKDGFQFFYYQQRLSWYPNLVREMTDKARAEARRSNIAFEIFLPLLGNAIQKDIPYPLPKADFLKMTEQARLTHPTQIFEDGPNICVAPWTSALIHKDGNLKPCCLIHASVGNIYRQPFAELFNGEAIRSIRRGIIEKKLHAACMASGCQFALKQKKFELLKIQLYDRIYFDFVKNNTTSYVETRGLSFPEYTGTWFCEKDADITYKLQQQRSHLFNIELSPFLFEGLVNLQEMVIKAGSHTKILQIAHKGFSQQSFVVPEDAIGENGQITVHFDFPNCASPSDLCGNGDPRLLSFHVSSLWVEDLP